MSEEEFQHFIVVLRAVYMGRTSIALPLLADLSAAERSDWYRLADLFRTLIGEPSCADFVSQHSHNN
jgi:hypothetical protein